MWKAIFALALALPCLAHAEPVLDTGFGTAGIVDLPLPGTTFDRTPHTAVLPDRRVVVAFVRGIYRLDWRKQPLLWLARLQPDGSPDPTFGGGAPVALTLSPGDFHYAFVLDFGVRPDGSLFALITFSSMNSSAPKVTMLVSVTADGRLDPAFNGGAPLVLSNRAYDNPRVFDTGSGYLAVGVAPVQCCNGGSGFDAWRLRADGTPDPAFGNGGSLAVGPGVGGSSDAMSVPGGGFQILNYQQSGPPAAFWRRYRADGSVDSAFGSGGEEALPNVTGSGYFQVYPLGDGTLAGVVGAAGGGACVERTLDAQGRTLTAFDGPCIGGDPWTRTVQSYGPKLLASNGARLWVLDRNGAVDRAFAGSQGDSWRPPTDTNEAYAVAADGDRGVVLASPAESTLRVRRYVDVRGGTAEQSIPALGLPGLLLLLVAVAALAWRRLAVPRFGG